MKKEIKHDKLMNLRIATDLFENYKNHCNDSGFVMSTRIRFLIKKDIENKIKIEK